MLRHCENIKLTVRSINSERNKTSLVCIFRGFSCENNFGFYCTEKASENFLNLKSEGRQSKISKDYVNFLLNSY